MARPRSWPPTWPTPPAPACGCRRDAHLAHFRTFATPERDLIFDINDLDETLPAPWEWDVKRLAASVVLAGRFIQLTQRASERAAYAAVRSYRHHMGEYPSTKALDVWYDKIGLARLIAHFDDDKARARFQRRVEQARARSVAEHDFPKLAERRGATPRIKENPPLIFHTPEVQEAEERGDITAAWAHYHDSLPEHVRVLFDRFHRCDMAIKVVGVGSVGTVCVIALFMAADEDPLFMQITEAKASAPEPYAGTSQHSNHGQRVVVGQRLMQAASDIFLG